MQNQETKKVLVITYYWPPSGGAGVQRWLKFARYLPEFGVEPLILTVDPAFASYPQNDKSLEHEVPPSIKVFKTKSFESLKILSTLFGKKNIPYAGFSNVNKRSVLQTLLRFIRGNFFIPDARIGWNKYAYAKAKEIINTFKIDTVITSSPPHSSQLIGLKLKKNLGIRWIADLRDPWTDIYYYDDLLHTGLAKKIDHRLEKKILKNADNIIVVGEWMKQQFLSKMKQADSQKYSVITNGFDEADFLNERQSRNSKFTITYTGTLSDHYTSAPFVSACKRLKGQSYDFSIRFVGNVSESKLNEFKDAGLSGNIELINYVNHTESIQYLYKSDALLLIIPDFKGSKGILTGKLFEYLASKKPIIAIGDKEGDAATVINECNAGKIFTTSEDSALETYLKLLIDSFNEGTNMDNSQNIHLNYSRKKLTQKLVDLLR